MDLRHLRIFQRLVADQCFAALAAFGQVNRAFRILQGVEPASDELTDLAMPMFWVHMGWALGASANASKALWGAGNNTKVAEAREELRRSLEVPDDSPLRVVKMRNNFEHIDERIDEWAAISQTGHFLDQNIGSLGGISLGGGPPPDHDVFRHFDPETGDLIFWGQRFNVPALANEVGRIHPIAVREAIRPSVEPPPGVPPSSSYPN